MNYTINIHSSPPGHLHRGGPAGESRMRRPLSIAQGSAHHCGSLLSEQGPTVRLAFFTQYLGNGSVVCVLGDGMYNNFNFMVWSKGRLDQANRISFSFYYQICYSHFLHRLFSVFWTIHIRIKHIQWFCRVLSGWGPNRVKSFPSLFFQCYQCLKYFSLVIWF